MEVEKVLVGYTVAERGFISRKLVGSPSHCGRGAT